VLWDYACVAFLQGQRRTSSGKKMAWGSNVKRKLGKFTFIASVFLLALTLSAPAHAQQQKTGVKLSVEAAYEGYYRSGEWLPVLVSVSNTGPGISGLLRLTAPDLGTAVSDAYNTPIDLPQQSSKQVFLYLPVSEQAHQVKVELVSGDRIVANDTRDLTLLRQNDMLFALVTDSPRGIIDLKAIRSGLGDAYQANWHVENIPRMSAALRGLDALILMDVDSGALVFEQRQAIRDWVLAGGHLIVTGGPNWQKTQAGIADLLPMQPSTTTTLTALPSITEFAGKPKTALNAASGSSVVLTQGKLVPDAQVLAEQSGVPLIARHNLGGGLVDYIAFDPGLSPFDTWSDRGAFWFNLIATDIQRPSWSDGITDPSSAYNAANYVTGLRLPDVLQLVLFLGFYIALIGPINYLILWRFKRREWAWFTIPAIVLVTAVIYYLTGFSLRGTQAIVNRLAVVQVWPGGERGQVDAIIGVLAPRRGAYDLSVESNYTLRAINGDDKAGNTFGPSTALSLYGGQNYEARGFPVEAGTTVAFTSSGYTTTTPIEGQATITLTEGSYSRLQSQNNSAARISGTVRNTTGMVLQDVVVLSMGGSQLIGTLNPGDVRDFRMVMDASARYSPPVSLGNSGVNMFAYGTGAANRNLNTETTIRHILGQGYFATQRWGGVGRGFETSQDRQELYRRYLLLLADAMDQDPTGGRGTSVYVIGWTNTSPVKVDLKGAQYGTEDTTMYIYQIPVNVDAASDSGVVELPNPFITWTPTSDSTRRDTTPYNLLLQPGDRIIFRYTPMPLLEFKDVVELRINLVPTRDTQARQKTRSVLLWNWTTSQWEQFDFPITEFMIKISKDAGRFIGPKNNAVEIRIDNSSKGVDTFMYDSLDVTLYGHLAQADK